MTLSSSIAARALCVALLLLTACGPELAADASTPRTARSTQALSVDVQLVITEVMVNPGLASNNPTDENGEWFEVHNPGSEPVELRHFVLASANDAPFTIEANLVVPAGGYVVLGASSDRAVNGGVPVDLEYGTRTFSFSNSGADWISIKDPAGRELDRVSWTNGAVAAAAGRSRALLNVTCDNFEVHGAAWTTSSATFGVGERGTPGAANVSDTPPACPVPVAYPRDVRITEVMANPQGDDTKGEWFEVHNPGTAAVNLRGWTLRSNNATTDVHRVAADVVVPAGGYAVFGNNGDSSSNGGTPVTYAYPAGFNLSNSADFIQLERPDGVLVDRVAYSVSVPNGASRALLKPDASYAADVGGYAWANSTETYGSGANRGSPGAANPPPVPGPEVSFNSNTRLPVGYVRAALLLLRDAEGGVLPAPQGGLTWSSSNEAVAVVDARGYVTAAGVGTAFITVTLPDGSSDAASINTAPTESPVPVAYLDHLAFGTPRDATPEDELLIRRPQFALSYNAARGGPNWVAWELNASHVGAADRCNCFTPDPTLPAGVPVVEDADYRGGGYDRGHMVQSFNRTATEQENAATFLMTNILPQAAENNQGPWGAFENFITDLARFQSKEVYIGAGGWYPAEPATLRGEGKVAIPDYTWKVAVVVDRGEGLAEVSSPADLQVYAVWMPNRVGVAGAASADGIRNDPWTKYETTVARIQARVGYDLLALLPDDVERVVEQNHAPIAAASASRTQLFEGDAVDLSAAGTSDEDGQALTYRWTFSDGAVAEGATVSHSFADDGAHFATLTVTDPYGEASTATVALSVSNVAPALAALPTATLLPGETYAGFGAFADPGADAWTGTVTYGDGSPAAALSFVGQVFGLSHTYRAAGTYAVTVAVQDDDGGRGTAASTVVVLTQQEAVGNLEALVDRLPGGCGEVQRASTGAQDTCVPRRSLLAKLQAARRQLDRGNAHGAANQLGAFVNEVESLERSGRLAAPEADVLLTAARRILRSM